MRQIDQTDFLVRTTAARVVQALAPRLSESKAPTALKKILQEIERDTAADTQLALAKAVQGLPVKLSEAQGLALQPILRLTGEETSTYDLAARAEIVQVLAPKLHQAHVQAALEAVLRHINRLQMEGTTEYSSQSALGALFQAVQALAPKLNETQAQLALAPLLKQIGQKGAVGINDPLKALPQVLQALAPMLSETQTQAALALLVEQPGMTYFSN